MSDKIQIEISAKISDGSISEVKEQIKALGASDANKINIEADVSKVKTELQTVEKLVQDIGKAKGSAIISQESLNSIIEAKGKVHELNTTAKDVEQGFRDMGTTMETSMKVDKINAVTNEMEQFTVKVKDNEGNLREYTNTLVTLEDGTNRWVQTAVKGMDDQSAASKRLLSNQNALLTTEKQLNQIDKKLGTLDKQSEEYKRLKAEAEKLRDVQKENVKNAQDLNGTTLNAHKNQTKELGAELDKVIEKQKQMKKVTMSEFGSGMQQAGRGIVAMAAPIVAAGGAAIKSSIDFETAFAGVRKTTEATEAQFDVLEKGMRDLSLELPQSAEAIAGVGEVAGQLGIPQEKMLAFTETMIMLGDTTNMSSEKAADSLARFANITQMSFDDFDRLGATVVDLGNNFATTETEIVEMGLRLAGTGREVGLTEGEIMGMATALSSVGLKAQLGGTAFSRIMVDMAGAASKGTDQVKNLEEATGMTRRELELLESNDGRAFKGVADSLSMTSEEVSKIVKAGGQLEEFAKIAGMTGDEFAKAFEEDAMGAITAFIEGLASTEDPSKGALEMLDEMGITQIRLRDALLRSGGAHELFSRAIETGNTAWSENVALTNEAEERYKTTASQIQVMKNRVVDAGISLGKTLAPALLDIIEHVAKFVEGIAKLPVGVQGAIVKFAALATVLGTVMMVGGRMIRGGSEIFGFFKMLGGVIGGTTTLVGKGGAAVGGFSKVLGGLSGATGLAVAAGIGAVGLVAKSVADHVAKVKEEKAELDEIAKNIPEIVMTKKEDIKNLKGMRDEFTKLNALVGENGDLSKMSAEEQETYLGMVRELKDTYPELETYYNNQGQLIADTEVKIKDLIDAKREEIEVDKEKATEGLENRIEAHKQENDARKADLKDIEDEIAKKEATLDKYDEGDWSQGVRDQIKELKKERGELTKGISEGIDETMSLLAPAIQLMGQEIDLLNPHVEKVTEGIRAMLEIDPSNEGIDKTKKAIEDLGKTIEEIAYREEKGIMPFSSNQLKEEISTLTDAGMDYATAAGTIFEAMSESSRGAEGVKLVNTAVGEFNETGEISKDTMKALREEYTHIPKDVENISLAMLEGIAVNDEHAAALIASTIEMDEGMMHLVQNTNKYIDKIKPAEVMDIKGITTAFGVLENTSEEVVGIIKSDADLQKDILRWLHEDMNLMTSEQHAEAYRQVEEDMEDRLAQEQRYTVDQQREVLKRGQNIRDGMEQAQEELLESDAKMSDVWENLDDATRTYILEQVGVEEAEGNFEAIQKYLDADGTKEYLVHAKGMQHILEEVDLVEIGWNEMTLEEQMFYAEFVGQGLEDAEDFQEKWNNTKPEVRKFIAEMFGAENVETASEATMNKWAEKPGIKEFVAAVGGIDVVMNADQEMVEKWAEDPKIKEFLMEVLGVTDLSDDMDEVRGIVEPDKVETKVFKITADGKLEAETIISEFEKDHNETKEIPYKMTLTGEEEVTVPVSVVDKNFEEQPEKVYSIRQDGAKDVRDEIFTTDKLLKQNRDPAVYVSEEQGTNKTVRGEITKTDQLHQIRRSPLEILTQDGGTNKQIQDLLRETARIWRGMPNNQSKTFTTIFRTQGKRPTGSGSPSASGHYNQMFSLPMPEEQPTLQPAPQPRHGISLMSDVADEISRPIIEPLSDSDVSLFGAKPNPMPQPNIGNTSARATRKANEQVEARAKARSEANKKEQKEEKAKADIYQHSNNMIARQNALLKRNSELQSRASDDLVKRIRLVREELSLERQHAKLLNNKLNMQIRERNQQEAYLRKQGFRFKGKGHNQEISNLSHIKGKSKAVEEVFDKYNDLQFNLIPSVQADIMGINTKLQAALSKGFEQQTRIINNRKEDNNLLEINAIHQERAVGNIKELLRLKREEQKINEHKAYLERGEAKILNDERRELEKTLRKEGFEFHWDNNVKKVSNTGLLGGKPKEVEEVLDRYNELVTDVIPKNIIQQKQLRDIIREIDKQMQDAMSKGFEQQTRITNNRQHDNHLLEMNAILQERAVGDLKETLKLKERELELHEHKAYLERGEAKILNNERRRLEKELRDEGFEFHWDNDIKKVSNTGNLKGKSKEMDEVLNRYNELVTDLIPKSVIEQQKLQDVIDKVADSVLDIKYEDQFSNIDETLEGLSDIQELLQYEKDMLDDDNIDSSRQITQQMIKNELEYRRVLEENVIVIERQFAAAAKGSHEWDILNDAVKDYNKQLRSSNLEIKKIQGELINLAKEQAKIDNEKKLSDIEKSIFNGKTEEEARKELDDQLAIRSDFIRAEEKELEIARIRKMVEEEKLELTKEQQKILKQSGGIERDKLDRLDKQLNIQKEQNRLANMQNQKTIRQLTKNTDGTFGFEYVADEKAIIDAEKSVSDAKKDLIDWESNYRNEQDEKNFKNKQDRLAKEEKELSKQLEKMETEIEKFYKNIAKLNTDFFASVDNGRNNITVDAGLSPRAVSFDTDEKMAVLHEKDIVLNKEQTKAFSKLVASMPDMLKTMREVPKIATPKTPQIGSMASGDSSQTFNIDKLEFPNVRDAREIEGSIRNLSTFATQWAKK